MSLTMNAPLSVENFRTHSDQLGKAGLEVNQEGTAVGRSGACAWIKSFLNIGGARQAAARTLEALRNAVRNDPHYARVTEQADAMLGRLSSKYALTGRQITQFLGQLDTAAQTADAQAVALNKALVSKYSMNAMSLVDKLSNAEGVSQGSPGFRLSSADRTKLISLITDRIHQSAGDFRTTPDESAVRQIFTQATRAFSRLLIRLDAADLPPD